MFNVLSASIIDAIGQEYNEIEKIKNILNKSYFDSVDSVDERPEFEFTECLE